MHKKPRNLIPPADGLDQPDVYLFPQGLGEHDLSPAPGRSDRMWSCAITWGQGDSEVAFRSLFDHSPAFNYEARGLSIKVSLAEAAHLRLLSANLCLVLIPLIIGAEGARPVSALPALLVQRHPMPRQSKPTKSMPSTSPSRCTSKGLKSGMATLRSGATFRA